MRRKLVLSAIVVLLSLGFLLILPGTIRHAYDYGRVLAYDRELTITGLTSEQSRLSETHHMRVEEANRAGVIYAALSVGAFPVPVFFIIILSFLYAFSVGSKKLIFTGVVSSIVGGIAFSTLARVSLGNNMQDAFVGSALAWVFFILLVGITCALLWAMLWVTKRAFRRKVDKSAAEK